MKNPFENGNWWLRILALALAIILYHVMKTESVNTNSIDNERHLFQYH